MPRLTTHPLGGRRASEPTRCPTRSWLVRKITEARDAGPALCSVVAGAEDTDEPEDGPDADDEPDVEAAPPVKLTKMSVDELRLLYRRIIGRDTGSTAKGYLVWKLREAMKGKIKVGAIERAATADTADMMVLPLRMARHEVEEMDKVWPALGFASRTAFLRRAITEYTGLRAVEG